MTSNRALSGTGPLPLRSRLRRMSVVLLSATVVGVIRLGSMVITIADRPTGP
ncbi:MULTISPECIES: hypothetical protein [unclassified Streptomyces]|uniref:hypothetical protein n=1 Tax=unclassified Streptomyces TaxID=2593676 RepID=UPI0037FAC702